MTDSDIEQMNRATWGRTIENRRRQMDLTQAEFGRLFVPEVTQSTVTRWERGSSEPRILHRIQMGRIFGIPPSMLFSLMDVAA